MRRRSRRRKKDDSWVMGYILLLGLPAYLLFNNPWLFWLVFVPIVGVIIFKIISLFKRR